MKAIEDRNRAVRLAAVEAAPKLASLLAPPALRKAARDWRSDVVLAAVEGIGKIGGKQAMRELEQALAFRGRLDMASHFITPLLLTALATAVVFMEQWAPVWVITLAVGVALYQRLQMRRL